MPVLASKDIVLTVQPMQQSDLDAAFAFMKKVCTEDVYWEGIRNANTDRGNVTGDMQSFIEIVPDGDGYRFIRNMNDYNMCGVKADNIPGWYAAQKYSLLPLQQQLRGGPRDPAGDPAPVQHPRHRRQRPDLHGIRQVLRKVPE